MKNVLIIEDDREIRKLLTDFLESNEYSITQAENGRTASEIMGKEYFDIILMDMMLPYKSGAELIKELRESEDSARRNTPVIVISAKTMKDTRLEVLRMGADDYIIKPFDLDEVLVRIEVLLRRMEVDDKQESGELGERELHSSRILTHNGLEMNLDLNSVTFNGEPVKLTFKEMHLLELFLRNPQKTFTKANLYETVWEDTYCYDDNTINVHMSNLRSKLKKATETEFIETVWGIGYKLSR